jgi:hypothetical protein
MKKILSIFGVLLFIGSLALSSCNTSSRLCPAYPPSVLQGNVDQDNMQLIEGVETLTIQEERGL